MTTLTRWEPFRELATLRDRMDHLWDEVLESPRFWPRARGEFTPALDVTEEDDAYTVKASIPGFEPDDIEVTLSDNVLTIKGEAKEEKETEEKSYHIRERRYGSFMRSVSLPVGVNSEEVEATTENGVMTLRLPKTEEVKPKKIAVKTVGNGKAD